MSEPGHVSEPGGVVVQTEGGDPEPVDVMRRGRDVVLGESISAETGVISDPRRRLPRSRLDADLQYFPNHSPGLCYIWAWSERTATMHGIRCTAPPQSTSQGRYAMTQVIALSLSIAVLGGIWAFLALGPLSGFVLVWAGFIGWGCFFHSGANNNALVKTIVGNAYGALVAWVALLIIVNVPVPGLGAVWPAIVVGVTVFFLVIVASIDLLSVVPANVYGYAALVAYSLHQPPAAPATGPLHNLVSPSFANPLVLLIVSMVIGALFGYASDQLAKVLPTKLPTRASA